jgi:hypothetical protein
MGKETFTSGEKQSPPEERDIERLERITKRDSDSSEGGSSVGTDNVMTDTINDVDMMKSSPAIGSVAHSSTASELASSKSTNRTYCELHSEEEKQDVTEITNGDNRDASAGRNWRARRSDSVEEEEEQLDQDVTPGAFAFSNEEGNLVRRIKGRIAASVVEEGQNSSPALMENDGPTSPFNHSEPRGPSDIDDQSLIIGELAEAFGIEEELERRLPEYESVRAITGTAIVDNSDGVGDHARGRKSIIFLIGATLALLLVVGVIVGVTSPLTTNNNKDSPSIESALAPTQSPAPTKAPTAAPMACTSLDCLSEILMQNGVADAEAFQDKASPQFLALRWLANNDPALLALDSTSTVIVARYVLVVLYFASSGEGSLNALSFLTTKPVCEWQGVSCNGDGLVVALVPGKSKHGEVIVLISKFCIDSPVHVAFRLIGMGDWG